MGRPKKTMHVSDKNVKGVEYVTPEPPKKQEMGADFYSARYKYGYDWRCYQPLAKRMLHMMAMTGAREKKVLDVGCGIGWFTDQMYFNISRHIKGIDFSRTAINYHCKRMYPAFPSEVADVYNYDYNGYDVFVLMEILEHLDKDLELIGMFPKGAKVYATVPFEKQRMDFAHVREYGLEDIRKRYGGLLDIQASEHFGQFIIFWGVRK